jgi:hypothetical protein
LKYDNISINYACGNGHVHILEWFKNEGYDFKNEDYNNQFIRYAFEYDKFNVLNWFKINFNIIFMPKSIKEMVNYDMMCAKDKYLKYYPDEDVKNIPYIVMYDDIKLRLGLTSHLSC